MATHYLLGLRHLTGPVAWAQRRQHLSKTPRPYGGANTWDSYLVAAITSNNLATAESGLRFLLLLYEAQHRATFDVGAC